MKMFSLFSCAILVASLLLSSGCLDAEQSLVIKPNGSGTLVVKYRISEETVQRVDSMLKLSEILPEEDAATPPATSTDKFIELIFNPSEASVREQLDAYAKLGFKIDEFKFRRENAKRIIDFTLSFDDISVFSKADFFHTYGFTLRKNSSDQYVIYNRPLARDAPSTASWDFSDPEVTKLVAPFLNGFRFVLDITVPGRVLKSNAHQARGNLLKWAYEFDTDPYAIQKMQREQLSVVFESRGITLPEFDQPPLPAE